MKTGTVRQIMAMIAVLLVQAVAAQDQQPSVAEILKEAEGAYYDKNYDKAISLFSKISDYAEAQFYLGVMCENGYGVAKDYAETVSWYRKAADQGDARAQARLKELGETY